MNFKVWFQKISIPSPRRTGGNSDGGGGWLTPKILKETMKLNWNFQRGGGAQTKKPSMGGVWIFSGTTQYNIPFQTERLCVF